jgi:uncharacterized protein (TIGR03437 family)
MRRSSSFRAFLAAFALVTLAALFTPVQAETVTMNLALSPLNEVPPITTLTASGGFQLTLEVTRDANGAITGGKVTAVGFVNFPGAITITGFHIHEGPSTANGGVRFDSGITSSNSVMVATGVGLLTRELNSTDAAATVARLTALLSNPTGFYLNLHTTVNPGGAIRAQLTKWVETRANTVTMSPAQEVPPIAGLNATATAAIIVNPTRNATTGQVNGGSVTFNIAYEGFPAPTTFTGLHIHEAAAGVNGSVRFDTGITATNNLVSPTGKGTINITVPVTAADRIAALGRLLDNPAGFYVNLHTTVNPGGAVRGQLTGLSNGAPAIAQANTYFLPTGGSNATVSVLATGIDLTSTALINGQQVLALPDLTTGFVNVTVPAALLANPGVLQLQVRSGAGVLSSPLNIVVAAAASVNNVNIATVDAASFGTTVAPESIAAAFGTKLASTTVLPAANATVLPVTLDGTAVYVNGVQTSLFFVSEGQANFMIPEGTAAGPAQIVIVAKDGTVSRGQVNVTNTAPAFFTRLANGKGAPAAVASTDGQNFTILMSNPDGTPVEISAGNTIALFGTGLRFKSGDVTATAGGVTATPSFVGAQGTLIGLDQVNLTIPQGMAGKGEMDLVFTVDGKMTNAVKIKVK